MLLIAAWRRLLFAAMAVAGLWASVLWVAPSTPSTAPGQPPVRVAAPSPAVPAYVTGSLRAAIQSGAAAPGGGRFDRFNVTAQPIVAPVNARGQVAFYATVLHGPAREGIFLANAGQVTKVAAFGDSLPGGGTIAALEAHPLPALNSAGHVAFAAHTAGGRATEGVFLAGADGLQAIALAGDDAPGVPAGVLVAFDAPALNDNDELAFVASVRTGRDLLDVLYYWNGRRLQRLVAERELLRIGGTMDQIGDPTLNNSGVVAFPAAIFKGPALGGIFVAGARPLRLLVRSGDQTPGDAMILRFSERVAIDEAGEIAFGAHLGQNGATREAVLRTGTEGLAEIAVEGAPAPGGGRYAGFGPWPTVGPGGVTAFIAALDGGPGPLAAFAGAMNDVSRVATMGETLPQGGTIGRFALNTVAVAGPNGALTFATVAQKEGERNAIYCRCPESTH